MIGRGPLTRLLAGRTARTLFGMLLLLEAIFAAESFTSLLEDVTRNGGSALDLIVLLTLEMPGIVDFALPVVLLLGLYFAILSARNENELIVCAAAGVPWVRIPAFAASVGLVALVVSLLFSGVITPLSKYTQRLMFYKLEVARVIDQIVDPGQRNTIRNLQDRTVIATPRAGPDVKRGNLFIFQPNFGESWRVSQADDWTVEGPDETGGYAIRLKAFRDYTAGGSDKPEDSLASSLQFATVTVKSVTFDFRVQQIVHAFDAEKLTKELTLVGLASGAAAAGKVRLNRRLGEMLARALLCPFAALLAVAGVAMAGARGLRYVALPAVSLTVLGADLVTRTAFGDAAEQGWGPLLTATGIGLAAALILPSLYIRYRGEAMIAPSRDA